MLKLAQIAPDHYWIGENLELNLSYANLRDYQWKRLLEGLWAYPGITGPFEKRYIPNLPEPTATSIRQPEPTATLSQYGAFEMIPDVRVGFELLCTRSLFECISLLIPLSMFETVSDPALLQAEQILRELALRLYKISRFDLAALGVNRECQLLTEMLTETRVRDQFLAQGNFLAQDDILLALHSDPEKFPAILPALRWSARPE